MNTINLRPSSTANMNVDQTIKSHEPADVRQLMKQDQDIVNRLRDDEGAATAEYAVVIMAAVALAGVLVAIMRSGEVQAMLLDLVQRAFGAA